MIKALTLVTILDLKMILRKAHLIIYILYVCIIYTHTFSLSLSHTHTHTRSDACTHIHTHTHTLQDIYYIKKNPLRISSFSSRIGQKSALHVHNLQLYWKYNCSSKIHFHQFHHVSGFLSGF